MTNEVRLICDGLLILQERDSNNVPKITYTRGVDLSGTLQGAGGIGGMLGLTTHTNTTNYTHYFYHSDGGGNITAMIDTNQVLQAQYAYEPFGKVWSQSGPLTNLSRYRFSSKEWHSQSDSYFYQFRIYVPDLNRWLTEDPIGIAGGINLKRFVHNNPLGHVDPLGFAGAEAEGEVEMRDPVEQQLEFRLFNDGRADPREMFSPAVREAMAEEFLERRPFFPDTSIGPARPTQMELDINPAPYRATLEEISGLTG